MQINDSCASFEDGFQSRSRNPKDRALSSLQGDIAVLQQKQKAIWSTVQKVKQTNTLLKKQTKSLVDNLREEFKQKSKWKIEKIQTILSTLDSKVEFVVNTCDRYVKSISDQLSQQFSSKSKEEQQRQVILQSYSQFSQRIRVLQQKSYAYKQNEDELRKQLEFVMQKNSSLAQQLNSMTVKSSEKIQQLENALRQKVDEIRRKNTEILRRQEIFRKDIQAIKLQQVQQAAAVQQQQQQQQQQQHQAMMAYQQQVQQQQPPPIPQQQQQVPGVNQLSRLNIPPQPNITPISFQSPKQQYLQVPRTQNKTQAPPLSKPSVVHYSNQPPSLSISHASSVSNYNCNNMEIKPDFFKAGDSSQISELPQEGEFKGIFLKSLRQEEAGGGINVRKLKESTDSGNSQKIRFGKKDQSHRFDYLINNLAATQGQSTHIYDGYGNDTLLSSNPLNHHMR